MPNKEKIFENYVEPDITIEYIFVEKADEQIKPINDDQGYLMGFFSLFITGTFKNDNLNDFKTMVLNELNYSVKTYDHFKSERINLNDYKFGLINNDKNVTEFNEMDEVFFQALLASLRNLMIVGKNLDIEKFKFHEIFNLWFDKYTNRS
ncbi:MAG: hypothetical protein ACFE9I_01685 [Candidatus Hermodarchaeota archaeon]